MIIKNINHDTRIAAIFRVEASAASCHNRVLIGEAVYRPVQPDASFYSGFKAPLEPPFDVITKKAANDQRRFLAGQREMREVIQNDSPASGR